MRQLRLLVYPGSVILRGMDKTEQGRRLIACIRVNPETDCWEWQGSRQAFGYGGIQVDGKKWRTHRLSYFVFVGALPEGMLVCHKCDNPPCVNPSHLFLGTHSDNMMDASKKGRIGAGDHHWTRRIPERLLTRKKSDTTNMRRGERHGIAKLTAEKVREIRAFRRVLGWSQQQIADVMGVTHKTIGNILAGKIWTSVH